MEEKVEEGKVEIVEGETELSSELRIGTAEEEVE